eukprot:scaffold2222_cov164-Amphora_coffeaeformis.AAC.6
MTTALWYRQQRKKQENSSSLARSCSRFLCPLAQPLVCGVPEKKKNSPSSFVDCRQQDTPSSKRLRESRKQQEGRMLLSSFAARPWCVCFEIVLLLVLLLPGWTAVADASSSLSSLDLVFHDYTCPAQTVCPLICVNKQQQQACPTVYTDDDDMTRYYERFGGSCPNTFCDDDDDDDAWTPCPAAVNTLWNCHSLYGDYYQAMEEASSSSCRGNHRSNVSSSSSSWWLSNQLLAAMFMAFGSLGTELWIVLGIWTTWVTLMSMALWQWHTWRRTAAVVYQGKSSFQQGWRSHTMGKGFYVATVVTRLGWGVMLGWLAWQYYVYDDDNDSQEAVLRAFITIWCIGLVWNLLVPNGTALSLWTRAPCPLSCATQVTFAASSSTLAALSRGKIFPNWRAKVAAWWHNVVMQRWHQEPPIVCDVYHLGDDDAPADQEHGTRFVTHQLQRYTYQPKTGLFEPAVWEWHAEQSSSASTDTTGTVRLRDFTQAAVGGLSSVHVYQRWQAVGDNIIDLPEPHFGKALHTEISQPFYTYQWFMIASWLPLSYYYMACKFVRGFDILGCAAAIGCKGMPFRRPKKCTTTMYQTYSSFYLLQSFG